MYSLTGFVVTCVYLLTCVMFELAISPEITLCVWRGYKPSMNKKKKDRYLMFYAQSTGKGHIRVKPNVSLPQVQIMIHNLIGLRIPPLRIRENFFCWFLFFVFFKCICYITHAEAVPNCLVAYTTRAVSRRAYFTTPYPAGGTRNNIHIKHKIPARRIDRDR